MDVCLVTRNVSKLRLVGQLFCGEWGLLLSRLNSRRTRRRMLSAWSNFSDAISPFPGAGGFAKPDAGGKEREISRTTRIPITELTVSILFLNQSAEAGRSFPLPPAAKSTEGGGRAWGAQCRPSSFRRGRLAAHQDVEHFARFLIGGAELQGVLHLLNRLRHPF